MEYVIPATLAGAFTLGLLIGFVACMRLFKLALEFLKRRDKPPTD